MDKLVADALVCSICFQSVETVEHLRENGGETILRAVVPEHLLNLVQIVGLL